LQRGQEGPLEIGFDSSTEDLEASIERVFDSILTALKKLPRVEHKIYPSVSEDNSSPLALNIDDFAGAPILKLKNEIKSMLRISTREAKLLLTLYSEFVYILGEEKKVVQFLSKPKTLSEYKAKIDQYRSVANLIAEKTHSTVRCPLIVFDCSAVNQLLVSQAHDLAKKICEHIATQSIEMNNAITDSYRQIEQKLVKVPPNTQELVETVRFIGHLKASQQAELKKQCLGVRNYVNFLLDIDKFPVEMDVLKYMRTTWNCFTSLPNIMKACEKKISDQRTQLEVALNDEGDALQKRLEDIKRDAEKFHSHTEAKKASEYLNLIAEVEAQLIECETIQFSIRDRQVLLDRPESEFQLIGEIRDELKPFFQLWTLQLEFSKAIASWNRDPVFDFKSEQVENDVNAMLSTSQRLFQALKDVAPSVASNASNIKKDLTNFKAYIPLLHILCNEGMRPRHWDAVSDICGFEIKPSKVQTLSRYIAQGVDKHVTEMSEISETASKQFAIEKSIKGMKAEWEDTELTLKSHRDTGTYILVGESTDECSTMLDDHALKTQSMKGNPFAAHFLEDIILWEKWLDFAQQLIIIWLKVQSAWMYLEPVFGSADIMRQMPTEGAAFKLVDNDWHHLMSSVQANTLMTAVTAIPNIKETLVKANHSLEQIQLGLARYLETKRLYFPRFYFLSNDDLLAILSETKDPLQVQPHLKKCFEGIEELEFKENLDISAMKSKEGEVVKMCRIINPQESKGNVEVWMAWLETVMAETIAYHNKISSTAYVTTPRTEWALQWPGQTVLAASQIHWTHLVETAITSGPAALPAFLDKSNADLNDIVRKVRGRLQKLGRATFGALIVIDVHARDVVMSLVQKKISSTVSFEWMSQLRYYLQETDVMVKCITASISYGNEYLGNSMRLVITPLTDRCYRTLMGAMQLQYGGAPEGPAGTGKTETVKDLAKAVANFCVVFNCSDSLDTQAMAEFFKGLSACGAWACFDEFNRIDPEVLSVIAQQLQVIQVAKDKKLDRFLFEGSMLPLKARCAVFITMNPGYAGRAELPDNLKALFRTVAMMVPDYALIAEIELTSFGYVEAQKLSKKIVATYKLCSEQLSSQDHYDYGMRAVKAVLNTAARLKQSAPDDDESLLVLRAISDVNLPKFLAPDIPLFEGIISDLFPGVVLNAPPDAELLLSINNEIKERNLQPNPPFIEKILQLYDMTRVRHGLMIVGLPFAGKSSSYKVLSSALSKLAKTSTAEAGLYRDVKVTVINPKSINLGQLYGRRDPVSLEWSDGVLAAKFRKCSDDRTGRRNWLMFDGPVDALWIENMNTVLDDSKKLCLISGIIMMSDLMNMVFETRDLAVASPATVSRCGMVYMEPGCVGWRAIIASWIVTLTVFDEKQLEIIRKLFDWLVPSCLRFVMKQKSYSNQMESNLVMTLTHIFRAAGEKFWDEKYVKETPHLNLQKHLESVFLFSLIWSIGACVDVDGRAQFDAFLREVSREVNMHKLTLHFPSAGQVYDYIFNVISCEWEMWTAQLQQAYEIPSKAKYQDIVVPTVDTIRYSYLLNINLENRKPMLLVGPTGTGKSVYVKHLIRGLNTEKFVSLVINFSARTSSNQTQFLIEEKISRIRNGVFAPTGGKRMVVFVDDLSMPKVEKYGAQAPVELLRQYLDSGGWYDYNECEFKEIVDTQLMCAMGPAPGGVSVVTDRFLRYMSVASVVPFADLTLTRIFGTLIKWHLGQGFSDDVREMADKIVSATRDIYAKCTQFLLPLPSKSHYTFNLRDFSKVIQGMCMSKPPEFPDTKSFCRLWIHEAHRVFADRLVDAEDGLSFLTWTRTVVKEKMGMDFDEACILLDKNDDKKVDTVEEIRGLFFGGYIDQKGRGKVYQEYQGFAPLQAKWLVFLQEYYDFLNKPLNLVLFSYAIEHASRIARILLQPGGNALLVGVGGTGKRTLARLASFVVGMTVVELQMSRAYKEEDWRADLKKILKIAGGQGKPTVFLFADSHVKKESYLEDVNSILNSGDVPNLWDPEDIPEIIDSVRPAAKNLRRSVDTPAQVKLRFLELQYLLFYIN